MFTSVAKKKTRYTTTTKPSNNPLKDIFGGFYATQKFADNLHTSKSSIDLSAIITHIHYYYQGVHLWGIIL